MRPFIEFFVDRHLLVNIIAILMVVSGLHAVYQMQREGIPSFDMPVLWVTAVLPGASARDVETKITIPVEEAIETVEGIEDSFTTVSDSVSFTTIELYEDFGAKEIQEAEQDVRNAIEAITDFPPEMEDDPTIVGLNPARLRVVEVAITAPDGQLEVVAEYVEQQLEQLSSVAIVTPVGLQDPEVRILVEPSKALAHNITLDDIITAISRRNVSSTGGNLEGPADQRQVVMWSRYHAPEDVGDTVLRFSEAGGTLRIKDIARIESGREDTGLIVRNDGQRGITLQIQKRGSADIIDTVNDVRDALAVMQLPEGASARAVSDESEFIAKKLRIMAANGWMGMFLVVLVLLYFVRLQPAIWVAVGIPVVFMGALGLFGQTSMTLNMAALSGFILVLGLVVDDAVVVSERIAFRQAQGLSSRDAAIEGTLEIMPAVMAATLTTIIAFAPLISIGGLPGKIIWQIPAVVVIVLLMSILESFFVLPAHMSTIKAGSTLEKREFVKTLESAYRRALDYVLRHRPWVLTIALFLFVLIMSVIRPQVPFILFPQDDAHRLFLKVSAPLGTALEQTEAYVIDLEQQITAITEEDLDIVMSRVGHQSTEQSEKEIGDAGHEALMIVQLKQRDRKRQITEWIDIIQRELRVPEPISLIYKTEYYGPPTDSPVTLHVLTNNDELRRGVTYEIEKYLHEQKGVIEIEADERPGTPQIDLNIDFDKLALLGLDSQTVGRTLSAAFYGIEASEHRTVDETTKLRVMLSPAARIDLDSLLDVPIRASDGRLHRLRDVVSPVENAALTRIYHRNGYRAATVRASFALDSGQTAITFASKMEQELLPRFEGIPGLEVTIGGEAQTTKETAGSTQLAAMLALFGITVVIWLMLGSLLETLFVLVVIPFSLSGVFLTFWLHGMELSMYAVIAAVGLIGVVVNSAILMVALIHRRILRANSPEEQRELMIDAAVERLRPLLVTTLTTVGGLFPTAYSLGGYDSMMAASSLAMGWGLVYSTAVTLFIVPVLYSYARDISQKYKI